MTIALLDEAPDLDYAEAMRNATARLDRDACDWPELRRAILEQGGIGSSPDWDGAQAWPGDLYTGKRGKAPDRVATETLLGDVPPWSDADGRPSDDDMHTYLWRSWEQWQRARGAVHVARGAEDREREARRVRKAPAVAKRAPGTRSFAELVRDLREKHGADVDLSGLSGLRSEYVSAYESGERVTVERDGRTYRGTVGATRGARPRFVLLLSLDL